jgi:WhiB family redox-sensing transcriptional regulator
MPLLEGWDRDPAALHDLAVDELVHALTTRPAWHALAACRGVGTAPFFVGRGGDATPARAYCETCAVRVECLDAAVVGDELGLWAGVGQRERRGLRRQRHTAA